MLKLISLFLFLFAGFAKAECTSVLGVDGAIGPATLDYIERGMVRAEEKGCSSILLTINTPGGNLQTTRLIVEKIINSKLPFLCLVHPSGGHAGSAGAIILQGCHVNGAMETTNIGAATPVMATGQDIAKDMRNKMVNDTVSWVQGLAKLRGRSEKFAEDIIAEAKAVEAQEALELKAIDFVVDDIQNFVDHAHGRKVKVFGNDEHEVVTGPFHYIHPDLRYQVLQTVTDPQFAYMIFMGSLGLLYFELTHPGMMAPGIVGAMGLIVSMISFHKLNVDWAGVLLIVLGMLLMLAEAFVPSFGALGIGGLASFIFGSLLLYDPAQTGVHLPLGIVIGPAIVLGGISYLLARMAYKSFTAKKGQSQDLYESKVGKVVEVGLSGREGQVFVLGETWKFQSDEKLEKEDKVKVVSQKGLTLKVIKDRNAKS